jgi:SAM-dependent methyltransferase
MGLVQRLKARLEPLLLSDTEFIDKAFRDILGREADKDGLDFYRGVLRQGVSRTALLLDLARSEEFRNSLAPAKSSALSSLVPLRPERYRRTTDRVSGQSILVFDATSPADFDWLESAIVGNRYYEKPGVWVLGVDFDKRLVAEMIAAFAPQAALEIGCAAGAVLDCLADLGVAADGVEISSMAIAKASDRVRGRIHQGDLLSLPLGCDYDLVFGLDVFEHFNPNKLTAYLARIAAIARDEALLFCNIPAFGEDAVFGTVFPLYVDGWAEEAAAGRAFSRLHSDETGYPIHGHLTWADAGWWTRQFEAAGFTREIEIERAFHRKYDAHMMKRAPARRVYFVFGRNTSSVRREEILQRIAMPSRVLA